MRKCSGYPGHRKPRENVRNVFLHKIFKDRYKMESIATPVKKLKTNGRSYHSIRYKPKKISSKRIREISFDDVESDLYEDALEEFYDPYKSYVKPSSVMIKLTTKDGIFAEISDPGYKTIDLTKQQLVGNTLELIFNPIDPKLAILLGGKPIYVTKKTIGHGDYLYCDKTDVGIQTSLLLPNIDFENDICTTQQNVNSLLIETTGKQVSFDELPYDNTLNYFNYNPASVKLTAFKGLPDNELYTENSHQNIANKFRDKSFTNLVNTGYDNYYCSHTSLVSSLPSDEVCPSRKFSMKRPNPQVFKQKHKRKYGHTMVSTLYANDNLSDVSDRYLTEIIRKTKGKINFKDEEELKRLSEPNALCFIDNSEDSSFDLIIDDVQNTEEGKCDVSSKISTSVNKESKEIEDVKNDETPPENCCNEDKCNIEVTSNNLNLSDLFIQDLKSNQVLEKTIQETLTDDTNNVFDNKEENVTIDFSIDFIDKSKLYRSPSDPDIISKMELHSELFSSDVKDEDVEVYLKEMETVNFFGDERPPSPIDPNVLIFGKYDIRSKSDRNFKTKQTTPSPVQKSRSSSNYESKCSLLKDPLENPRPQTASRTGSRERPMTSVSQALKGVETALKPLQDQLKEIRTKMASLNNQFYTQYNAEEVPNVKKKEKTLIPIKENEVLPTKFVIDKNKPKLTPMRSREHEKFTKPAMTRHEAISIWTEPEDIIGDSSQSMNLSLIGVKKNF